MNKEELRELIDFKMCGKEVEIPDFKIWIDNSQNWQVELGCLSYLLSQILEKRAKKSKKCLSIIDLIYRMDEQLFFRIHECDYDFVKYMLRNLRHVDLSLEDELIMLHTRMCEHIYEQYLRY